LVVIAGATRLGLLNKKAGKALEMINWMRNNASPAHDNDQKLDREDVMALAMMLTKNLFQADMPDPGHSVSSLFDPVKAQILNSTQIDVLADQIRGLKAGVAHPHYLEADIPQQLRGRLSNFDVVFNIDDRGAGARGWRSSPISGRIRDGGGAGTKKAEQPHALLKKIPIPA
jgi:hypothetical protein